MRVWIMMLLLVLSLTGCASAPATSASDPAPAPASPPAPAPPHTTPCPGFRPEDAAVLDALRNRSVPLGATERFDAMLDGVQVAALGESAHGAHEFFTAKSALVRHLVAELGYTALLMEADYTAALAVNDYIRTGTGSAEEAVAGLGWWINNTAETVALVEWLRQYNQGAPPDRQVWFAGFDLNQPERAAEWLTAHLARTAPDAAARFGPLLKAVRNWKQPPADSAGMLKQLQDLHRYLADRPEAEATHIARGLVWLWDTERLSTSFAEAVPKRERGMAETVLAVRGQLSAERVVLWGAGTHFARMEGRMGPLLHGELGNAYYVLGAVFGQGSFTNVSKEGLKQFTLGPVNGRDYVEAWLGCIGSEPFLLDLRGAAEQDWVRQHRTVRYVPGVYDPVRGPLTLSTPLSVYDGLLYVPQISPSQVR